jgi:hypothetical protein
MNEQPSHPPKDPTVPTPLPEKVQRDPAGKIVAYLPGASEPVTDVEVARCFPWSVPDQYISLRDEEGAEIAMIKEMDQLDEASQRVIQEELDKKVFNPKILEILDYAYQFGVASVTARTDRGEVKFQIRSRDDVRLLSPTRALFRDADGNIYELEDVNALDPASRKYLAHYF